MFVFERERESERESDREEGRAIEKERKRASESERERASERLTLYCFDPLVQRIPTLIRPPTSKRLNTHAHASTFTHRSPRDVLRGALAASPSSEDGRGLAAAAENAAGELYVLWRAVRALRSVSTDRHGFVVRGRRCHGWCCG